MRDRAKLAKINDALIDAERQFLDPRGLRGRAWYKHTIYAPGFYTGYAAIPLTDFRQGIDDRNTANAKEGLERIVEAVKRVTKTLKSHRLTQDGISGSSFSSLSSRLRVEVCWRLRGLISRLR